MRPVRLVIVDDEPLALRRLRTLLSSLPNVEVADAATGYREGREAIIRHRPDLALLDVRMGDGTAFDLLSELPPDAAPMVAFATAYPRYACEAFGVDALDYLLKPVEPSRLEKLVNKAARRRDLTTADQRARELEVVLDQLRDADAEHVSAYGKELWIRRNGVEHVRVSIATIDWFGALDDYVGVHAGGVEHLLRSSLDSVEEMLDPSIFTRIHRSSIVRIEQVVKVVASRTGTRHAVLKDGTKLAVGRTYAKRLVWTAGGKSMSAVN